MFEAIAGALISGGISAISGSKQAGAVSDAAAQSSAALLESTQLQVDEIRRQYDLGRADIAPWREFGRGALEIMGEGFGLYPSSGGAGGPSGAPAGGVAASGAPRYSVLASRGDVDSSGNSYDVGTGPNSDYASGVYWQGQKIREHQNTTNPNQGGGGTAYDYEAIRQRLMSSNRYRYMDDQDELYSGGSHAYLNGLSDEQLLAEAESAGIPVNRFLQQTGPAGPAGGGVQQYGVERREGGGEFLDPLVFDPSGVQGQAMLELDPGYDFRQAEGQKALERSLAAGGHAVSDGRGLASGRGGKALLRWGQDLASQEYGNAYNRAYGKLVDVYRSKVADRDSRYNKLAAFAQTGQTAATNTARLGAGAAANIANAYGNQGAGLANIYQGQGAAQANIYGGMGQNLNNSVQGYLANSATQKAQSQQNAMLQSIFSGGGNIGIPSYAPNVFQ